MARFLSVSLLIFFSILFLAGARNAGAQARQDLGWRLVGTAVGDDPAENFAIIEIESTRGQGALRVGDRVGEALIKEITPGYIVVDSGGGDIMLFLGSGGREGGESEKQQIARLDRGEVNSKIPQYRDLMQEIRVRSRFVAGRPSGFVIYKIEPNSIFEQMGLRNGDAIVKVNGKPFDTTQPVVEFYDAIKEGGTVALEIRRGEKRQQLQFEIR